MSKHTTQSAAAWQEGTYTAVPNDAHLLVASPREYQLIALLLSYRWRPESPIVPSVGTLASALGCTERTVRRTAARLEAAGLLRRIARHASDARQLSNEYVLCGALLAAVTRSERLRARGADTAVRGDGQRWPANVDGTGSKAQRAEKTEKTRSRSQPPPSAADLFASRQPDRAQDALNRHR